MADTTCIVWPVGPLSRVFPMDEPPKGAPGLAKRGWNLAGAGGQTLTCQLGLRTDAKLDEIEIAAAPLKGRKGEIPAESIRVRWVGLVPVSNDSFHTEGAERPDLVPAWYPDPLLPDPPWTGHTPPRSAAVHLTVPVPRDLPAGVYRGKVTVRCQGEDTARVPLRIEVWPFAIPERPTFHVTNWFHLDCLTAWHRCEPWSERHWHLIEQYGRTMAEHRQDTITTPTLFGNFHNFDQMTLVDVTRERHGRYTFDFSRLERWVDLFDRLGFRLFEMWHLASQHHGETAPTVTVFEEAKGAPVRYEALPTTGEEYRALVASFLLALSSWLDRRGLTDRFLLHIFDEPGRESWPTYARLSEFYRKHAPALPHIDAISESTLITEFGADVDIPVPLTPHLGNDTYYQERAKEAAARTRKGTGYLQCRVPGPFSGTGVWWYTCCGPTGRFANRFVYQPLITTRILQWQAFAHHIRGYLHWGYNFWHRTRQEASGRPGVNRYADDLLLNPYREHPNHWPVGDACIVYPHPRWWEDHGPVSSLRYEAMREGLEDYELLRMLDQAASETAQPRGKKRAAALARGRKLLEQARGPIAGSLTDFCRDPEALLKARAEMGASIAALG